MSPTERIEIGDRIVFMATTPHGEFSANRAVIGLRDKKNPVVYFMGENLVIRRDAVLRVIKKAAQT